MDLSRWAQLWVVVAACTGATGLFSQIEVDYLNPTYPLSPVQLMILSEYVI